MSKFANPSAIPVCLCEASEKKPSTQVSPAAAAPLAEFSEAGLPQQLLLLLLYNIRRRFAGSSKETLLCSQFAGTGLEDDLSLCVRGAVGFYLPGGRLAQDASNYWETLETRSRSGRLLERQSSHCSRWEAARRVRAAWSQWAACGRAESDLAGGGGDQMGSWEDRGNLTSVRMVWRAGELWWSGSRRREEMTSKWGWSSCSLLLLTVLAVSC